jgi:hypothetical protein
MSTLMPPPPPADFLPNLEPVYPCRGWRKVRVLIGVVSAFFILLTIPGWFALRSYSGWRDGEIQKPAWVLRAWSWYVVVVLVLAVPSTVAIALIGQGSQEVTFVTARSIDGIPVMSHGASGLVQGLKDRLPSDSSVAVYGSSRPEHVVLATHIDGSATGMLEAIVSGGTQGAQQADGAWSAEWPRYRLDVRLCEGSDERLEWQREACLRSHNGSVQ